MPALRASWLEDLRLIEQALIPVIRDRAQRPVTDHEAQLSAAALVAALRVALEQTAQAKSPTTFPELLADSLGYLRHGASL